MEDNDGFQIVSGKKQNKKPSTDKIKIVATTKKQISEIQHSTIFQTEHPKVKNIIKKRIMCNNMIIYGSCPYGCDCVYAHSLNEQKLDPMRKKAYDIILSTTKLDNIDLIHDKELYIALMQLTRICFGCENGTCLGGYNCKNGAINTKLTICYNDFYYGKCVVTQCYKQHLTKRGMVPFKLQHMLYNGYKNDDKKDYVDTLIDNIPKPIELNDKMFPQLCSQKQHDIDDDNYSLSDCEISDQSSDEIILVLKP